MEGDGNPYIDTLPQESNQDQNQKSENFLQPSMNTLNSVPQDIDNVLTCDNLNQQPLDEKARAEQKLQKFNNNNEILGFQKDQLNDPQTEFPRDSLDKVGSNDVGIETEKCRQCELPQAQDAKNGLCFQCYYLFLISEKDRKPSIQRIEKKVLQQLQQFNSNSKNLL